MSLTVSPTSVTVKRDSTARIDASVMGAKEGTVIGFASADTMIATVTAEGVVRGIGGGATTVVVTGAGLSATVSVVVLAAPLATTRIAQPLGSRPYGAAVSPHGVVYVTRLDADSLARADLPATSFPSAVPVGDAPAFVSFDTAGATAYVANLFAGHVSVVNVLTGARVDSIVVNGTPWIGRVSPDDQLVWVTTDTDSVYAVSRASRTVVARVSVGAPSNGWPSIPRTTPWCTRAPSAGPWARSTTRPTPCAGRSPWAASRRGSPSPTTGPSCTSRSRA